MDDKSRAQYPNPLFTTDSLKGLEYFEPFCVNDKKRDWFLVDLFFRLRFFGSKKHKAKSGLAALQQSWSCFVDRCQRDIHAVMASATACEQRYYQFGKNGRAIEIHRECHRLAVACAVPPRVHCPLCDDVNPRRITSTSMVFAKLHPELRAQIKDLSDALRSEEEGNPALRPQGWRGLFEIRGARVPAPGTSGPSSSKKGPITPSAASAIPQRDSDARTRPQGRARPVARRYELPTSPGMASSQASARGSDVVAAPTPSYRGGGPTAPRDTSTLPPSQSTAEADARTTVSNWSFDCDQARHEPRIRDLEECVTALREENDDLLGRLERLEAHMFRSTGPDDRRASYYARSQRTESQSPPGKRHRGSGKP